MDFLDPKQQHAHKVRLIVGYFLLGIAILCGTVILLYLTYGFSLNDDGKIIQNGLIFVSSTPSGSKLYVNGRPNASTNARLTLPTGTYTLQVERTGYRTWERAVTVEGGTVVRFDYALLFPQNLVTTTTKSYSTAPVIVTQSLDRRWLLLEQPGKVGSFDMYDLSNIKKGSTAVTIPSSVLPSATPAKDLSVVSWANDNRHVLLEDTYHNALEYILFDTQNPADSVNLTKTLNLDSTSSLTLQNEDYNNYFIYDSKTTVLGTASLNSTTVMPMLQYVLAYKTYGTNVVLYATSQGAPTGDAKIMLYQNGTNYQLRTVTQDSTYLLNLTQYSGSWYVAVGSPVENRVYVYQDPATVLQNDADAPLVPVAVLKVQDPNYLAFSTSAQFIMAENANSFSVYDVRYDKSYAYTLSQPFDKPQQHATWMDGDHLTYISNGKVLVFDYDSANQQILQSANPDYTPFFDTNYKYIYVIASQPATTAKAAPSATLTSTSLLIPADQ